MHQKLRVRLRTAACAFTLCTSLIVAGKTTHADTITLTPSKDNTLIEDPTGASSNGTGSYFFAGTTAQGVTLRSVLAFNLNSIPAGSTITAATLTLRVSMTQSASLPFALHRLTKDWGEGASSSIAGTGADAETGDATWIHTFYNSQLWTTPGGDFEATPSATQNVAGAFASYTWGSTTGMVADVQQWIDTPAANFGWIVIGGESATRTAKRFDSRENGTSANRPQLTVTYTLPAATATLSGTLTLQGIALSAPAQTITFLLHPSDNSGDSVKTASVAPNGVFQLSDVPRKNYSLRIKGDRYLSARVSNVDASGGNVSGITALLKAGDANNDNAADIADLLLLINSYNKVSSDAGYLATADFNLDGSDDIADLLLLIGNYNQLGDN